jgi:hemolysin activation/secretion protein
MWRGSFFARWNSVTGVRDTLYLQLQKSEGAESASVGYSRPVGGGGGRVVGSLSYSNSSIIGGDFQGSNILSDSYSGSLSYRRPVWVRPDSYAMIEAGATYVSSSSTFDGQTFSDITVWDAFASARYNRRFANSTLGISAGVRFGNADAMGTSQTEGTFWMIYGEGTYARPLSEWFMFNGNLRYQYAHGQNLPVARLFTAGGVGSVRGYPSDIRGGDSGALLNLQVSMREPWSPAAQPDWDFTPFAFADAAMVVPYRVDGSIDASQDFLASLGAGVSVSFGARANLVAMAAMPLRNTLGFDDAGNATFHVGLDFTF